MLLSLHAQCMSASHAAWHELQCLAGSTSGFGATSQCILTTSKFLPQLQLHISTIGYDLQTFITAAMFHEMKKLRCMAHGQTADDGHTVRPLSMIYKRLVNTVDVLHELINSNFWCCLRWYCYSQTATLSTDML